MVGISLPTRMGFPDVLRRLPEGKLSAGLKARVLQGPLSQCVLVEAEREVLVPDHVHSEEWGLVIEGEIEMMIAGKKEVHRAGDEHFIPAQVVHSFRFEPGTRSLHYFNEPNRVQTLPSS